MVAVSDSGRVTLARGLRLLDERTVAYDLYATLTLLVVLLYAPEVWQVSIPLIALSVLGFAFVSLRMSAPFWFAIAVLIGLGNYLSWAEADNHKYLMGYWALALC